MTLAPYVQILGRGPARSRDLTQDEAREAMGVILNGHAAPEATGALLMLLRMKGETAAELAGFVEAARAFVNWGDVPAALDWPSYAAGRTRGLPWFLLGAKLVAQAGYPVLIHGWNSHQHSSADVRKGLSVIGIEVAATAPSARAIMARDGIAYAPLETVSPQLFELLRLRDVLGLRSCINTVLRLLNPSAAHASVQGVFHPSYREVQADACALLGQPNLTVIKGGGGEFERHPSKDIQAFGLRAAQAWHQTFDASCDEARRLNEGDAHASELSALWDGSLHNDFARSVVLGTAALALDTLGVSNAEDAACALWATRNTSLAA